MDFGASLSYNDELHEYRFEGRVIPSVTQVLPQKDFFVSAERLEECRREGKQNHADAELFILSGETFGNEYAEGVKRFLQKAPKEWGKLIGSEVRLWSNHKYAGTADLLFENAVVDIKRTFGDKQIHALQLAGYHFAAVESGLINRNTNHYILTIKEGNPKWFNVYHELAEIMFLSLVKRWWTNDEALKAKIDHSVNQYLLL
ncbi:MAG TPA: hypothetical protein PLZ43_15240 [bacterium]|nr:hypothetical protein [bacterium]